MNYEVKSLKHVNAALKYLHTPAMSRLSSHEPCASFFSALSNVITP